MKTFEQALGILRSSEGFQRKIDKLKPMGDEIAGSDEARDFLVTLVSCLLADKGPVVTERMVRSLALSAFIAGVAVGREMSETTDTAFTG